MSKNIIQNSEATVRMVIKISPLTAEKIRKIPARKRSKFVESAVLRQAFDEEREYAFDELFKMREALKGSMTTKQIVSFIRKDRRSH